MYFFTEKRTSQLASVILGVFSITACYDKSDDVNDSEHNQVMAKYKKEYQAYYKDHVLLDIKPKHQEVTGNLAKAISHPSLDDNARAIVDILKGVSASSIP